MKVNPAGVTASESLETENFQKKFTNSKAYWGLAINAIMLAVVITYQILMSLSSVSRSVVYTSVVTAYLFIATGYYTFLQSYGTLITVSKSSDTITATDKLLCGRSYERRGSLSQMEGVLAKEVRGRHGRIGSNVYIQFKNQSPIVFHANDSLLFSRDMDDLSDFCLGKNAEFREAKCCSCECACICPPRYCKTMTILVLLALLYISIYIIVGYAAPEESTAN